MSTLETRPSGRPLRKIYFYLTEGSVIAHFTVTDNKELARVELWRANYSAGSCDESTTAGCQWGGAPVAYDNNISGTFMPLKVAGRV